LGSTEDFYASIPFAAAKIDNKNNIITPNRYMCDLMGISAHGCHLKDILAIPEDEEWIVTSFAISKNEDTVVMLKKNNGGIFMGKFAITPSPTGTGHNLLWISEAQHLERANNSLKSFFDKTPQALLVCHPSSSKIMRLNQAAADLFGLNIEKHDLWGSVDDLIKPSTRKTIFQKVLAEKKVDDIRMMIMDANHTRIPTSVSARFLDLGGGNCILIGFNVGLSKLAEENEQTTKENITAAAAEPILNATPVPMLVSTLENGKIARLNLSACRLLQVNQESVEEGKQTLQTFFEKDKIRELLDQIKLKGEVQNKQLTVTLSGGKKFACFASARRALVDGREFAVIGLSDTPPPDTTGYEDFFDQAPIPMLLVESTDRAHIKRLNRRARELFVAGNDMGEKDLRLKHILGLRTYGQFRNKVKSAGFVDDFDTVLTTAYEEEISCLLSGHNVVVNGEELILVSINDITERKESELTLERFFNAAPLPMILSRISDGKVKRINRRASELFATPIDIERAALHLGTFLGKNETLDFFEKIKKGGFVDDFEVNIQTPYGETIWGLLSGQLINIDGDDCVMTGVNDITERKQVEVALKESREEALQATRQKSTFLSTMSHEIRTPMTGVLGMLELLHMTKLDEEQGAAVSVVKDSATALLTIIDDILDFSKIEAGRLKLENISFDIREVVEGAVELMGARARGKGLELICNIESAVPQAVLGDPTRLRQILLNLVGNAIKFTAKGAVIIRVKNLLRGNNTAFLRFEIEDKGIGISIEKQKLLFQPFSQTDASTSRHFGGTGLGLSICKALTELMNGQISIISEEGLGSTFWFEIGLEESEPEAKSDQKTNVLDGLRILVLQQHAETRISYKTTLESQGAIVCASENLKEALVKCQNECPDIAIIDHSHDDVDGLDTILTLQENTDLAINRIILTSSDYSETIMNDAKKMGILGRLLKPVRSSSLLRQVSTISGRSTDSLCQHDIKPREQMERETAIASGKMILFAEDNATNQLVIGKQLARLGYAYDLADNGLVALEKLQKTNYALLLTDCRMPEMNGLELSLTVRKNEIESKSGKRLPIVALTANATAEDADTCLSAGMDDYLVKPLKFEMLGAAMNKWLPLDPIEEIEEKAEEKSTATVENASPFDHPPIDLKQLGEILGMDDAEMFSEILNFFVETMDELIEDLNTAIQKGDPQSISDQAHAAKGACRNATANDLALLFEDMEKNVFTMSQDNIINIQNNIHKDVEHVKKYVMSLGT
jgi:signal transduction histidine kinase/DNA-binding response OmpR family regulator/HPt (histidine-containing phosphotransfer) domain-containing protein